MENVYHLTNLSSCSFCQFLFCKKILYIDYEPHNMCHIDVCLYTSEKYTLSVRLKGNAVWKCSCKDFKGKSINEMKLLQIMSSGAKIPLDNLQIFIAFFFTAYFHFLCVGVYEHIWICGCICSHGSNCQYLT